MIEKDDVMVSKSLNENSVDIEDIINNIDLTDLNKEIEKRTGLRSVNMQVVNINRNKYVNLQSDKNYVKDTGCLASTFDSVYVQTFNTEIALDKDMWYMTIHFRYQLKSGVSNGLDLLTAWYEISTQKWTFR